jgi:hypothetical protein
MLLLAFAIAVVFAPIALHPQLPIVSKILAGSPLCFSDINDTNGLCLVADMPGN